MMWLGALRHFKPVNPPSRATPGGVAKRDVRERLNYGGMSLLSMVGKVFVRVLHARLASQCESEDLLVAEQAGF